jgi:hypothetical protein
MHQKHKKRPFCAFDANFSFPKHKIGRFCVFDFSQKNFYAVASGEGAA